ncbi:hypothetical protein GGR51DRAFT_562130 [Nemania sp. FL0031]|nr:hypothetical protein GGR51DRAFT_562130 [Nemania sp. FL0031]
MTNSNQGNGQDTRQVDPVFDVDLGMAQVKGSVDIASNMATVEIRATDAKLGNFTFNLEDGLRIARRVFSTHEEFRFYMENQELWVQIKLNPTFGSWFMNRKVKIVSL